MAPQNRHQFARLPGPPSQKPVGSSSSSRMLTRTGTSPSSCRRELKEGYLAWLDTERLVVGTDWRLEIDQTIKASAAVLVVLSPEAKASEYVTYEWAFAWGVGVPVIPIMLKPTRLHPRLETLQFLDFT